MPMTDEQIAEARAWFRAAWHSARVARREKPREIILVYPMTESKAGRHQAFACYCLGRAGHFRRCRDLRNWRLMMDAARYHNKARYEAPELSASIGDADD